jgi:cyclopropane fatty-acyl-phospholipid synthase-like methyltransferase
LKFSSAIIDKLQDPKTGYDRIVSVEMLEHVGDKLFCQYFSTISNLLTDDGGGIMVIQGITIINPVRSTDIRTPFHKRTPARQTI